MNAVTMVVRFPVFWAWFAWQVLLSSWQIIADIMTTGSRAVPRVVRMPLESREDWQVTMIAALITLTPGTLTLGVVDQPDGDRALMVHSMYHPDTESALADLLDMEARMLNGVTLRGGPRGGGDR